MNQEKSTIKPPPFYLERSGARYVLHYDDVYTFACDGKKYTSQSSAAVRCMKRPGRMVLDFFLRGHLTGHGTFSLGQEPNTMTATVSHMRKGKSPFTENDSYTRLGEAGTSLVGNWKPLKTRLDTNDIAILRVHDGYLYYLDTLDGNVADAKLDGTPASWIDPHPENSQWSNVLVTSRKIVGHALVDGKPVNTETLELSPDGKSIKIWLGIDESAGYAVFEKRR